MGIKSIHIALIFCSSAIALIFGIWGLNNGYQLLGVMALGVAVGLIVYGIDFLKKAKTL